MGKRRNETSAKMISPKTDEEVITNAFTNPMEFVENVREISIENLKDVSVTEVSEVGTCVKDDNVEPNEKLEKLGIFHPYGGTRFYNRMFPDIPFQYVGKNPAYLGPSPKQLSTILGGIRGMRGIGEKVSVRNGEASSLKREMMNDKVVKIKAGPVQPLKHSYGEVLGRGRPELVQITTPTLYHHDFFGDDMCSADAFFVSIPNSAHPQSLCFPYLGAYSSLTGYTDREGRPQPARPEFKSVDALNDTLLAHNRKNNFIEVIDLSDEEDSGVISNCTSNEDATNSQVNVIQENDISTSMERS